MTVVELLSPANKAGSGRDAYLRKQAENLDAGVNLVEIDVLRGGRHTVAVERDRLRDLPPHDHLITTYRAAQPWGYEVTPWTLRGPVPPLRRPLAGGDPEPDLALQPLFDLAYDNVSAAQQLAYAAEPAPPLSPEDAAWADLLLRSAGLR